jgi:hypothetical protein
MGWDISFPKSKYDDVAGVFAKQTGSEADLFIQEAETRKGAVLSDPGLACKYSCHEYNLIFVYSGCKS